MKFGAYFVKFALKFELNLTYLLSLNLKEQI